MSHDNNENISQRLLRKVFFFLFNGGLLLQSHSLRQFARLSKSEKSGLSVLTPYGGCASYPNQRLFSFLSRAHTFPSSSVELRCLSLSPPRLLSCQHFHLDRRKNRLWEKKNGAIIKWDQEVLAFEDWRLLSYSLGFTSSSSSSTLTRCFIWCGSGTFPAGFTPATAHLLRLHYYFLYSRLFMEPSWVMISPCSYRTKKKAMKTSRLFFWVYVRIQSSHVYMISIKLKIN